MRKRTIKLWRLHEDGGKLFAGTSEAADPRELVISAPGDRRARHVLRDLSRLFRRA